MGKLLRVDLTLEKISVEDLNFELARKLIGGLGYAAKILYDETQRETDPFSPENRIIFIAGPLIGCWPGGTKWTVCSRSPLTYGWGESNASGSWGYELKRSGFDGIIIQGKADKPVYLWVHSGVAEVKKADHLWGMKISETCSVVKSEVEPKARVVTIGPAGEKLARFACIITDEDRVAGRTGMGTVMGSKNLKAIAVKGENKIPVVDEEKLGKLRRELFNEYLRGPKAWPWTRGRIEGLSAHGTSGALEVLEKLGGLPVKNFTKGTFPDATKIAGTTMSKTILKKRLQCPLCGIMSCWRYINVESGPFAPIIGKGPEYETLAAFGSLVMNDNLEAIVKANRMCDELGVDTISTGMAIAFAMECYEKGIISNKDTDGLNLTWGNVEAILKLIEKIGMREGFGRLLGEGVKKASEHIGKGSENFAIHVKGLELPMHEPRRWWTYAVAYVTNNRGACHCEGAPLYLELGLVQPEFGVSEKPVPFTAEGKAAAAKFHQDFNTAFTALGLCRFTVAGIYPFTLVAEAYSAITGWDIDHWGLLKCGERIWNLKRMFNIKMGFTKKHDTLPQRFLKELLSEGPAAGKVPPLETMLDEYYKLRGWDAEGRPTHIEGL